MRRSFIGWAGVIGISTIGTAYADCAADLAQAEGGASATEHKGISKDGSLAPLQDSQATASSPASAGAQAGADSGGNAVAKDGSTAPLEAAGNANTQQAMSGQDAQAQQEGAPTAAAQAESESGTDERSNALKEARAALDRGDEAACAAALAKAKAS